MWYGPATYLLFVEVRGRHDFTVLIMFAGCAEECTRTFCQKGIRRKISFVFEAAFLREMECARYYDNLMSNDASECHVTSPALGAIRRPIGLELSHCFSRVTAIHTKHSAAYSTFITPPRRWGPAAHSLFFQDFWDSPTACLLSQSFSRTATDKYSISFPSQDIAFIPTPRACIFQAVLSVSSIRHSNMPSFTHTYTSIKSSCCLPSSRVYAWLSWT